MDNRINDISSCNSIYGGNMNGLISAFIDTLKTIQGMIKNPEWNNTQKLLEIDLFVNDEIGDLEKELGVDVKYLNE